MSMNIIVQTRVQPKEYFETINPILIEGEIAINKEGFVKDETILIDENGEPTKALYETGIKIGDGVKTWNELDYLNVSESVVNDWLIIANGLTNSKLVTLPDLNIVYGVMDATKNEEIVRIVNDCALKTNYFTVSVQKEEENEENVILNFDAVETQGLWFEEEEQESEEISSLSLLSNTSPSENGGQAIDAIRKVYKFKDLQARKDLEDLRSKLTAFKNEMADKIEKLENSLQPFNAVYSGTVTAPSSEPLPSENIAEFIEQQNAKYENYLLLGNNTWVNKNELGMSGTGVIVPDLRTEDTNDTTDLNTALEDQHNFPVSFENIKDDGVYYVLACANSQAQNPSQPTRQLFYVRNNNGTPEGDNGGVYFKKNVLYGAAYNDYAEDRITTAPIEAGRVVVENGDDTLSISTDRLLLGGNIVSDTYGMLIGRTDKANTPIAVCGRVLAYPLENREEFYAGAPVCTGPRGTVSIMSKDEVLHFPECIIGYVSAIPNYEKWNDIEVKGRIWIKVV